MIKGPTNLQFQPSIESPVITRRHGRSTHSTAGAEAQIASWGLRTCRRTRFTRRSGGVEGQASHHRLLSLLVAFGHHSHHPVAQIRHFHWWRDPF